MRAIKTIFTRIAVATSTNGILCLLLCSGCYADEDLELGLSGFKGVLGLCGRESICLGFILKLYLDCSIYLLSTNNNHRQYPFNSLHLALYQ